MISWTVALVVGLTLFLILTVKPQFVVVSTLLIYTLLSANAPTMLTFLLICSTAGVMIGARPQRSMSSPVVGTLIIFLCLGAIQIWTSDVVAVSARWLELACAIAIALRFPSLIVTSKVEIKGLLWITWLVAIQGFLAILQFVLAEPLIPEFLTAEGAARAATEVPGLYRGFGTLAHPNALGILLVLAIPVAGVAQGLASGRRRFVLSFLIVVMLLGAFATLSRSSSVLAALAIVLLILYRRRAYRTSSIGLAATAASGAYFFLVSSPVGRLATPSEEVAARDASSNEARAANVQAAFAAWKDSPIFGQGWGAGSVYGERFGGYSGLGAHNTYLDVLSGGGLVLAVGFVAGGCILFSAVRRRGSRYGELTVGVLVSLLLAVFETLLQGSLIVLLGIYVAYWASAPRPGGPHKTGVANDNACTRGL